MLGRWALQQLAAQGEFLLAVTIGEEAVIANTLKSFWEDMEQEAADELIGREFHGFVLVVVAVVLPAKLDFAIVETEKAVVGDCDAVRVFCNVPENRLRSVKRGFGVDDPFGFAKGT